MAKLKLEITYNTTIWFYVAKMIGIHRAIKVFGDRVLAKSDTKKAKNITFSDIIAI